MSEISLMLNIAQREQPGRTGSKQDGKFGAKRRSNSGVPPTEALKSSGPSAIATIVGWADAMAAAWQCCGCLDLDKETDASLYKISFSFEFQYGIRDL
ncbi:hypothetical protein [Mesorhizobium sp.]|uniref:hypothetical protein n=1 Tax=Mesorhizobium sp. TaxID=1871066 RepID=UPI0025CD4805|nr:hypothetical protein [Mesorhizobium sp.]